MAFKKQNNDPKGFLLLMLLGLPLIASTNIDCNGKAFHCVNSTHFMICVDLGPGMLHTVDDNVIPCPPPTVCQRTNRFECEFPASSTPLPMLGQSDVTIDISINATTQPWEEIVTTIFPTKPNEAELSDLKYFNTVVSTTMPENTVTTKSIEPITNAIIISNETTIQTLQVTTESTIWNDTAAYVPETITTMVYGAETFTETKSNITEINVYETTNIVQKNNTISNYTDNVIENKTKTADVYEMSVTPITEISITNTDSSSNFSVNGIETYTSTAPTLVNESITAINTTDIAEIIIINATTSINDSTLDITTTTSSDSLNYKNNKNISKSIISTISTPESGLEPTTDIITPVSNDLLELQINILPDITNQILMTPSSNIPSSSPAIETITNQGFSTSTQSINITTEAEAMPAYPHFKVETSPVTAKFLPTAPVETRQPITTTENTVSDIAISTKLITLPTGSSLEKTVINGTMSSAPLSNISTEAMPAYPLYKVDTPPVSAKVLPIGQVETRQYTTTTENSVLGIATSTKSITLPTASSVEKTVTNGMSSEPLSNITTEAETMSTHSHYELEMSSVTEKYSPTAPVETRKYITTTENTVSNIATSTVSITLPTASSVEKTVRNGMMSSAPLSNITTEAETMPAHSHYKLEMSTVKYSPTTTVETKQEIITTGSTVSNIATGTNEMSLSTVTSIEKEIMNGTVKGYSKTTNANNVKEFTTSNTDTINNKPISDQSWMEKNSPTTYIATTNARTVNENATSEVTTITTNYDTATKASNSEVFAFATSEATTIAITDLHLSEGVPTISSLITANRNTVQESVSTSGITAVINETDINTPEGNISTTNHVTLKVNNSEEFSTGKSRLDVINSTLIPNQSTQAKETNYENAINVIVSTTSDTPFITTTEFSMPQSSVSVSNTSNNELFSSTSEVTATTSTLLSNRKSQMFETEASLTTRGESSTELTVKLSQNLTDITENSNLSQSSSINKPNIQIAHQKPITIEITTNANPMYLNISDTLNTNVTGNKTIPRNDTHGLSMTNIVAYETPDNPTKDISVTNMGNVTNNDYNSTEMYATLVTQTIENDSKVDINTKTDRLDTHSFSGISKDKINIMQTETTISILHNGLNKVEDNVNVNNNTAETFNVTDFATHLNIPQSSPQSKTTTSQDLTLQKPSQPKIIEPESKTIPHFSQNTKKTSLGFTSVDKITSSSTNTLSGTLYQNEIFNFTTTSVESSNTVTESTVSYIGANTLFQRTAAVGTGTDPTVTIDSYLKTNFSNGMALEFTDSFSNMSAYKINTNLNISKEVSPSNTEGKSNASNVQKIAANDTTARNKADLNITEIVLQSDKRVTNDANQIIINMQTTTMEPKGVPTVRDSTRELTTADTQAKSLVPSPELYSDKPVQNELTQITEIVLKNEENAYFGPGVTDLARMSTEIGLTSTTNGDIGNSLISPVQTATSNKSEYSFPASTNESSINTLTTTLFNIVMSPKVSNIEISSFMPLNSELSGELSQANKIFTQTPEISSFNPLDIIFNILMNQSISEKTMSSKVPTNSTADFILEISNREDSAKDPTVITNLNTRETSAGNKIFNEDIFILTTAPFGESVTRPNDYLIGPIKSESVQALTKPGNMDTDFVNSQNNLLLRSGQAEETSPKFPFINRQTHNNSSITNNTIVIKENEFTNSPGTEMSITTLHAESIDAKILKTANVIANFVPDETNVTTDIVHLVRPVESNPINQINTNSLITTSTGMPNMQEIETAHKQREKTQSTIVIYSENTMYGSNIEQNIDTTLSTPINKVGYGQKVANSFRTVENETSSDFTLTDEIKNSVSNSDNGFITPAISLFASNKQDYTNNFLKTYSATTYTTLPDETVSKSLKNVQDHKINSKPHLLSTTKSVYSEDITTAKKYEVRNLAENATEGSQTSNGFSSDQPFTVDNVAKNPSLMVDNIITTEIVSDNNRTNSFVESNVSRNLSEDTSKAVKPDFKHVTFTDNADEMHRKLSQPDSISSSSPEKITVNRFNPLTSPFAENNTTKSDDTLQIGVITEKSVSNTNSQTTIVQTTPRLIIKSTTPKHIKAVDKKLGKVGNENNLQSKPPLFDCKNRISGRYADNDDCRKFYVCSGIYQPIVGLCPINTVFSEIKKLCTRNLAHCIRHNQFKCVSEGRFSDFLKQNMFYICVKNSLGDFVRFKLQCQKGYHLNKTTVRCLQDLEPFNQSSSSVDSKSIVEKKSKENKKREDKKADSKEFECEKEGKFEDLQNCRRYYVCSKHNRSDEFRVRRKKCDSDEIFHKDKKKCVDRDSYECTS